MEERETDYKRIQTDPRVIMLPATARAQHTNVLLGRSARAHSSHMHMQEQPPRVHVPYAPNTTATAP